MTGERRKTEGDAAGKTAPRPPIWVQGRQRPKFDAVAFVRMANRLAQHNLLSAMTDASDDHLGAARRGG